MAYTVAEISQALNIPYEGDGSIKIVSISSPKIAKPNQMVIATSSKYIDELKNTKALVAFMYNGADWKLLGLKAALLPDQPRLKMAKVFNMYDENGPLDPIIHNTAIIDPSAKIGKNVSIGAYCIIGKDVNIGNDSFLDTNISIADNCSIGDNSLIFSGVKISSGVTIGSKFRCSYNTVIGSDGFSFVSSSDDNIKKIRRSLGKSRGANQSKYLRIASFGSVEIGNNVEIGSNCSIDSGTIKNTIVGNGTKIDNLVHIGHNVEIGTDTLLCGQVGIAGSAIIGDRVVLAGQCGVGDHTKVGDDVIAGGATKIFSNIPKGRVVLGNPAMKMDENIKVYKSLRRLPKFMNKFNQKKTIK
jgi:UDP-3-O-[3-hydroxymyristoyl] glucosamine N-acyltransferase